MKFFTLLAVVFTTAFSCMAQDFEGYYITNTGQKVEGFFKETDFTDPSVMQFKETRLSAYHNFLFSDVKEYGIGISHKYVKHTVSYDTSSGYDDTTSTSPEPQLKEATVFLNVLAEGKLSLYTYYFKGPKFFYAVDGATPKPLMYKRYKDAAGVMAVNEEFKKQLFNDANCAKLKPADFNALSYTQMSLTAFTEKYNDCQKGKTTLYTNRYRTKGSSSVSLFGGVRNYGFKMDNVRPEISRGSSFGWGVGVEGALKISTGTWEIFARLEFEKFDAKAEGTLDQGYNVLTRKYSYNGSMFSLGLGPRYNILMENSRIYIDVSAAMGLPSGEIESYDTIVPENSPAYTAINEALQTDAAVYLSLGVGYEFNQKMGVEIRYLTPRNLISGTDYSAKLGAVALNLRYTVF